DRDVHDPRGLRAGGPLGRRGEEAAPGWRRGAAGYNRRGAGARKSTAVTGRTMRTTRAIAILLCAAASLVASPAKALQPLEAFLTGARERNPDAQQARASLDQQNADAFTALGRQLPAVSVKANYYRNQYEALIGPVEGKVITIQRQDQWQGTATLSVPLIDLASFQQIAAARTSADSYARRLEATRLTVEGQTVQDYY